MNTTTFLIFFIFVPAVFSAYKMPFNYWKKSTMILECDYALAELPVYDIILDLDPILDPNSELHIRIDKDLVKGFPDDCRTIFQDLLMNDPEQGTFRSIGSFITFYFLARRVWAIVNPANSGRGSLSPEAKKDTLNNFIADCTEAHLISKSPEEILAWAKNFDRYFKISLNFETNGFDFILHLSALQHPEISQALVKTGKKTIIHCYHKKAPLAKELGMIYNDDGSRFKGLNLLGKAWANLRDGGLPWFVEKWVKEVSHDARAFRSIILSPRIIDFPKTIFICNDDITPYSPLDLRALTPIRFGKHEMIHDMGIQSFFLDIINDVCGEGCEFATAEHLYQFVRVVGFLNNQGRTQNQIITTIRKGFYLRMKGSSVEDVQKWADSFIGIPDFYWPHDFNWILDLKYMQNLSVPKSLWETKNKLIVFAMDPDNANGLGMTFTEDGCFEGCNLIGKKWMDIREHNSGKILVKRVKFSRRAY